jgi:hypothetical protein
MKSQDYAIIAHFSRNPFDLRWFECINYSFNLCTNVIYNKHSLEHVCKRLAHCALALAGEKQLVCLL